MDDDHNLAVMDFASLDVNSGRNSPLPPLASSVSLDDLSSLPGSSHHLSGGQQDMNGHLHFYLPFPTTYYAASAEPEQAEILSNIAATSQPDLNTSSLGAPLYARRSILSPLCHPPKMSVRAGKARVC